MPPLFRLSVLLSLLLLVSGCESTGITEHRFNAAYAALATGLEPADVLIEMGNPRDIIPADPATEQLETWVYSRPERVARQTNQTGEKDLPLPNGKGTVTVPIYEDEDVTKSVEYRLTWVQQRLHQWERVVLR